MLEEVARMGLHTTALNPHVQPARPHLVERHFRRKHGKDAYYGQR
ncbi:MAG: hypothetical protein ACLFMV_10785 [Spirochaetaceae bacterium]